MTEQSIADNCVLCIVMSTVRSERAAVASIRGIRVRTEHVKELAVSGSRAARTLKKLADAAGS